MTEGRRAERRAFIRAHHPDVGGDAAAFVAGLARLDARPVERPAAVRVVVVPTRTGLDRLVDLVVEPWRRRRRPPRVR